MDNIKHHSEIEEFDDLKGDLIIEFNGLFKI